MYLRKLEIRGFKSFADHTEISLNPGINIIVGPNGCGKSNIVDCIRWVLGESNVRNLRGQNAEDVIFNGTDHKKALGLASVNINIDNCDHILPVDFDAVEVSRKVYRSGESEFYLNKTRVRLKDIASLFTGTGLGKKGYSIISQGELEQVLNGQAFDRRLILEEASGIIRYRQQRDEVNRRISTTSSDLERAGDILAELRSRTEDLRVKAEKARTHQNLTEEYETLEKQVMAIEYNQVKKELETKTDELSQRKAACNSMEDDIRQRESAMTHLREELTQEQKSLTSLKEEKYETDAHLNSLRSDLKICEEKIRNWRERIESCSRDEQKYSMLLKKINKDLSLAAGDLEREEQGFADRLKQVQQLQNELAGLEAEGNKYRQSFEEFVQKVSDRSVEETAITDRINTREQNIKTNKEQKERLQIHLEELSGKIENLTHDLSAFAGEQSRRINEAGLAEAELLKIEKHKDQLTTARKETEEEYQVQNREVMDFENRLSIIRSQENNYTGYSEPVRLLMQANQRGGKRLTGILGVLGNLIEVQSGLELAIETAAGRGLENVVVEQGTDAQNAIEFIKKERMGRITFLPLNMLKVQSVPKTVLKEIQTMQGVVGIASQLVKYDPLYRAAVEYLLGKVLIVSDLNESLRLYKNLKYPLRLVTLEGDIINTSGAMSGGSAKNRSLSPLKLKNEEKELIKKLEEKRRHIDDINLREKQLAEQIEQITNSYNAGQENLAQIRFQNEMLKQKISQQSRELELAQKEKEHYGQDMIKVQDVLKELNKQLLEAQKDYRGWIEQNTYYNEQLEKHKTALEIHKREYEVKKERLNSYQDQLNLKKRELDNINKNVKQLEQVKNTYFETREQAASTSEQLNRDISAQMSQIQSKGENISDLEKQFESLQHSILDAQQRERQHLAEISAQQQKLELPREKLDDLRNSMRSLEISTARIETESAICLQRWRERFNDEPPALELSKKTGRDIRLIKERINVLQQQIEDLGSVDPGSIQEFDEVSRRCEFLQNQFNDLSDARDSLATLLEETETLMVNEFNQFMTLANESFNKTFIEIFGGGEASLNLDKGNTFEAGIDINVKMPGKRTQSLNLLSGGERALTCIAFIFSLLRLRPAPFCLLDEIDASLDEINLVRFSKFLQEMANEIQFIVITHRQVTIQAAENIYGVTMPEEGVSAVLSINLSDSEIMAG